MAEENRGTRAGVGPRAKDRTGSRSCHGTNPTGRAEAVATGTDGEWKAKNKNIRVWF